MASSLSHVNTKAICEAIDYIIPQKESVNEFITEFKDKGILGLWMDAKGFWNLSDKEIVLDCMEDYRILYMQILDCMESAANNDPNAYEKMMDLYKRIEELERDADIHVNGQSRALCRLAKTFLENHWNLNHNLKSVECTLLMTNIRNTKEIANNLTKVFNQAISSSETLQEINRDLKTSIDDLQEENQDLKTKMDQLFKENESIRDFILEVTDKEVQRKTDDLQDENMDFKNKIDKRLKENETMKDIILQVNERDHRVTEKEARCNMEIINSNIM